MNNLEKPEKKMTERKTRKKGVLSVRALKRTKDAQSRFLDFLQETGEVAEACQLAGIGRRTPYSWSSKSKSFALKMSEARGIGERVLLDEVRREIKRRGVEGHEEPVIYGGKVSMVKDPDTGEQVPLKVKRYSDNLLMFYAKRLDPDFRDNAPVSLTSGVPVSVNFIFAPVQEQPPELLPKKSDESIWTSPRVIEGK